MKDKQTAVEWLKDKLFELEIKIDSKVHEEAFFIFEQAKQMEKEQIIQTEKEMYNKLIQIYKETYEG